MSDHAPDDATPARHTYCPPERLVTERLALRPSSVADAGAIFDAYAADPLVPRFMGWRPHRSVDETVAFLRRRDAKRAAGTGHAQVIEDHTTGELMGMIEAHPTAHAVGYGYVLKRDRWGHGLMAEALAAMVADALAHPSVYRAHAFCDAENVASARVMEKAGMVREGLLRRYFVHPNVSDEPRDCLLYARVR